MLKHRDLTLARLDQFAGRLRDQLHPRRAPVSLAAFAAPDRIGFAEARQGAYRPIQPGHVFGPNWSTHWVRVDLTIPGDWQGREVHLLWDSGGEAAVWQDGRVLQGLTTGHRTEFPLTRTAIGGEQRTYYIEVACNNLFGITGEAAVSSGQYPLRRAELGVFDRAAWDLLGDLTLVAELARALPADSPRAGQALAAANALVNACQLDDPATWPTARQTAAEFLAARNGDGQHRLSAIGHAHIDTAWLWPLAETKRKCYRTFASAVSYMEDYPEYRFACSQAQQWAWIKETQPELYRRMLARVAAGQLIPVGGTWIEPDCNLPSGESLIRQFLYGQRFFEKELGRLCGEFWNPDVFGYSGQLPQIMRGVGLRYFLTQKLSWSQFNKIPHHTFWWEGIDGSRVLTHFPPADTYNGTCAVEEIRNNVRNYRDHDRSRESYYLFGYGDGGGGPTREMLERLRRVQDLDGLPLVTQRSASEFFQRLERDGRDLPVWVGELYLELHRGTYTTQGRNKRFNRHCEGLLHTVEWLWAVLNRQQYPAASLESLWKRVLLNQFHDIIPGSSITEVYQDSTAQYQQVIREATALQDRALVPLAVQPGPRVLVVNPLSQPRTEVVDVEGRPAVVSAPALGCAIVEPVTTVQRPVTVREQPATVTLENAFLRAVFGRDGRLVSLYDKEAGRETVPPGEPGNQLVLYDDNPVNWDAWDVDIFHLEKSRPVPPATSVEIVETGPLRATVSFAFALSGRSRLQQRVQLTALSRRLDFRCDADWQEAHQFLKVEFPWAVRAAHATYEIQFGHLHRPTHFNTSWDLARFEVCAQRWADLAEPDYGVALLNDCKYGHATHGHTMRLSLLRSPKSPDPQADMGAHQFTYAVLPHRGTLQQAGVIDEAARLNTPLLVRPTNRPVTEVSWFQVDSPAVVIDTVKRAEDSDALVLRLYEAHGTRRTVRVTSPLPVQTAAVCDLLERHDQPAAWTAGGLALDFTPFQIRTLKLTMD